MSTSIAAVKRLAAILNARKGGVSVIDKRSQIKRIIGDPNFAFCVQDRFDYGLAKFKREEPRSFTAEERKAAGNHLQRGKFAFIARNLDTRSLAAYGGEYGVVCAINLTEAMKRGFEFEKDPQGVGEVGLWLPIEGVDACLFDASMALEVVKEIAAGKNVSAKNNEAASPHSSKSAKRKSDWPCAIS